MSHYATIKCNLDGSTQDLLHGLERMGFGKDKVEVHEARANLYGYQGDKREDTAHVIIRRKHVGYLSNDIGFVRKSDGSWDAIISDYDRARYSQQWVNRLTANVKAGQVIGWAGASKWTVYEENKGGKNFLYVSVER